MAKYAVNYFILFLEKNERNKTIKALNSNKFK